jgi:hypothetical protein
MANTSIEKVNEEYKLFLLKTLIDEGIKSGQVKNFDARKHLEKLKKNKIMK